MNLKVVVFAAILGISAPAIIDVAISSQAVAGSRFYYPTGQFDDGEWQVNLSAKEGQYSYAARNLNTGDSLTLYDATTSGNRERQVYTWSNYEFLYQIAWRPSNPEVIRLQVISPSGKVILNRLLTGRD